MNDKNPTPAEVPQAPPAASPPVLGLPEDLESVPALRRVARRQNILKLIAVVALFFFANLLVASQVSFIYTLPWLLAAGLGASLIYRRPVINVAIAAVVAIISGLLWSGFAQSMYYYDALGSPLADWDFHYVIKSFGLMLAGLFAGWAWIYARHSIGKTRKIIAYVLCAGSLITGLVAGVIYLGSPVLWFKTYYRTQAYVEDRLSNSDISYEPFRVEARRRQSGNIMAFYKYTPDDQGAQAYAPIGLDNKDKIIDGYSEIITRRFINERSGDVRVAVARALPDLTFALQATESTSNVRGRYVYLNNTFYGILQSADMIRLTRDGGSIEDYRTQAGKLEYTFVLTKSNAYDITPELGNAEAVTTWGIMNQTDLKKAAEKLKAYLAEQRIPYASITLNSAADKNPQGPTFSAQITPQGPVVMGN